MSFLVGLSYWAGGSNTHSHSPTSLAPVSLSIEVSSFLCLMWVFTLAYDLFVEMLHWVFNTFLSIAIPKLSLRNYWSILNYFTWSNSFFSSTFVYVSLHETDHNLLKLFVFIWFFCAFFRLLISILLLGCYVLENLGLGFWKKTCLLWSTILQPLCKMPSSWYYAGALCRIRN